MTLGSTTLSESKNLKADTQQYCFAGRGDYSYDEKGKTLLWPLIVVCPQV